MEFKDKIKQLRKEKNVSQYKLADDLCISRSVIAKWETGLVVPSESQFKLIAEYFEVDVNELKTTSKKTTLNNFVNRKHMYIVFFSIFILLMILTSLTVIYHYPRTLSTFIPEEISEVNRIQIMENEKVYNLDYVKDRDIIENILNIKVIRTHKNIMKYKSSYKVVFYFKDNTYIINSNSVKSYYKTQYFKDKNYSLYYIISEYKGELNESEN